MNDIPVYLHDVGIICALGESKTSIAERLFSGYADSLSHTDEFTNGHRLALGQVATTLPDVTHLPVHQQTRSNQLLLNALQQIREPIERLLKNTDPLRVGVVLGVSTSGIREGEVAMAQLVSEGKFPDGFSYAQQEMSAPAESLAEWLGVAGPAFNISTACSSSAKALASARRLIRSGVCDLVIAGGVDSLCRLTVNGFMALESVSDEPCVPYSANRKGINIGEGAALFIVSAEPGSVVLAGVGETSDAHHISAPSPDGRGAKAAMQQALDDAKVDAATIDYLNLHGTATPLNDAMESLAVSEVFGSHVPCSSTKGYTGHTLGAAGAIEAAFCWLSLQQAALGLSRPDQLQLPIHRWDGVVDSRIAAIDLVSQPRRVTDIKRAMSNSFAFGGNNIALLLERVSEQALEEMS